MYSDYELKLATQSGRTLGRLFGFTGEKTPRYTKSELQSVWRIFPILQG